MGIDRPIKEYEKSTLNSLGLKYTGLKWCELGNQRTDANKVAKNIYSSLGVEHISIDLNGEDGALAIDLDKPVPFNLLNQFDVITNYGTIEYVNNQFQVFQNVHNMCKQGGIMIHILPPEENWSGHCRYYYSEKFVSRLAEACGYQIINLKKLAKSFYKAPYNLIAVAYIKKENNRFISKEEFDQIEGITDSGDLTYTGNYSKRRLIEKIIIYVNRGKLIKKTIRYVLQRLKAFFSP